MSGHVIEWLSLLLVAVAAYALGWRAGQDLIAQGAGVILAEAQTRA